MEFRLLLAIIVGLAKLVWWILRTLFRLVRWIFSPLLRAFGVGQGVGQESAGSAGTPGPRPARKAAAKPGMALSARSTAHTQPTEATLRNGALAALDEQARLARTQAATLRDDLAMDSIAPAFTALADRAERATQELTSSAELVPAQRTLTGLGKILRALVSERRDPALRELLIGADALGGACYRPIVEYCRAHDIALGSNRVATALGGDKLFFLGLDEPSGLALVVLPERWATELVWWPALAHEMGHDFYGSVAGLPNELAASLRLGAPSRDVALPPSVARAGDFVTGAVTAWQEELFADAFGTLMMGPAYVRTMAAIFGSAKNPDVVRTIDAKGGVAVSASRETRRGEGESPPVFDEHPPGHVRVMAACRLLADMGYGTTGDAIAAYWRRRHNEPQTLLLPTADGKLLEASAEPLISRATNVGLSLYTSPLDALNGLSLRSIPGLDFGPREEQESKRIAAALISRRPVEPRDPRLLVAGAIEALITTGQDPKLLVAQARIILGQLPHVAPLDSADGLSTTIDADAWRDAIVLGAVLRRPRAAQGASRSTRQL